MATAGSFGDVNLPFSLDEACVVYPYSFLVKAGPVGICDLVNFNSELNVGFSNIPMLLNRF